jgi:hypothetical protein
MKERACPIPSQREDYWCIPGIDEKRDLLLDLDRQWLGLMPLIYAGWQQALPAINVRA